jgi:hypothetical protein
MPAKCVSSVSPRFHYRRLAFCFLPLAAILEFQHEGFLSDMFEINTWGREEEEAVWVRGNYEASDNRLEPPRGNLKVQDPSELSRIGHW